MVMHSPSLSQTQDKRCMRKCINPLLFLNEPYRPAAFPQTLSSLNAVIVPSYLQFPAPLSSALVQRLTERRLQYWPDISVIEAKLQKQLDKVIQEERGGSKNTYIDEEGFTLVQSKTPETDAASPDKIKTVSALLTSSSAKSTTPKKTKKKGGVAEDFYRFQLRESREKEFVSLKRAFEADTAAVEEMKKKKKFRIR